MKKTITCVCGFTDKYDLDALGGYPNAYLSAGNDYELLTGTDKTENNAPLIRINAAVIFYNSQTNN